MLVIISKLTVRQLEKKLLFLAFLFIIAISCNIGYL